MSWPVTGWRGQQGEPWRPRALVALWTLLRQGRKLLRRVGRRSARLALHVYLGLLGRKKTRWGRWVGRQRKGIREGFMVVRHGLYRALKKARRELSYKRRRDKLVSRWTRVREGVALHWGERGVEFRIRRAAAGPQILVGPWVSEVGFEVLYWIPFLNWFVRKFKIPTERIVAVSRGGVGDWYQGIASTYVEIFDLMSPEEFAEWSRRRRAASGGTHKQLRFSALDAEIVARVKERLGIRKVRMCHPALMYRLFKPVWYGSRPGEVLIRHTRYLPVTIPTPPPDWGLPERYVAAKFYASVALPDTPENCRVLEELVSRVAAKVPVVLLDTGLVLDDHDDLSLSVAPGVTTVRHLMSWRNNLGVQTRVIAGAEAFVGTCGSVAWLAPMLGVDTVALFTDSRFLRSHLQIAGEVYEQLGAGSFSALDLGAAGRLGLLSANAGEVRVKNATARRSRSDR